MSRRWYINADGIVDADAMVFVDELKQLILELQPEATFDLGPSGGDPTSIFLRAYVDLPEPFDLFDKISDRVMDIQIEEGIPLHVLPMRLHERARAS
jgi:hypothetical protein